MNNNITKKIKPVVRRPGGKSRLLDKILPLIPPHRTYVEPFAGGLAVLLAKGRSPVEVINDLDGDLVNFYRCVKWHPDALMTELDYVLNAREEFADFARQPGLTDLQRAGRWFMRNKLCFGAVKLTSFGGGAGTSLCSRQARMDAIRALSRRLDNTTIEHKDWRAIVGQYDRADTFFFCDPPYTACDINTYGVWTPADMRRPREALSGLRGQWLLTVNDTPAHRELFGDCAVTVVARARAANNVNGPAVYRELIVRLVGIKKRAINTSVFPIKSSGSEGKS
jgi:DNA adenine methylase